MYETETNNKVEHLVGIPPEVVKMFGEMRQTVLARTVLPWGEHCTECVWPTCYSTCELYSPRGDGKCRRFVDGMVRVECPEALNSYLLKIRFKRWGKLWTPANLRLFSSKRAETLERRDYRIGSLLQIVPLPAAVRRRAAGTRYSFKGRMAQRSGSKSLAPTCFVMECYNPESHLIRLSLTIRSFDEDSKIPFQKLVDLTPGFHRIRVPIEDISSVLHLDSPFNIELIPNDVPDGTTLYFGTIDFIQDSTIPGEKARKVKCVVWDLDNTLWNGVLVEDGLDKLRLKPGVSELIQKLDQRGILNSVASKNNVADALEALKRFRLDEYFLCPQISWQPKSDGIKAISRQLNIGIDTLLFVDDSQFELQEVKATCPGVQLLNAEQYTTISQMKECQGPVTEESRNRRKMYKAETIRQSAAAGFGQDYFAFLRDCKIELKIRRLSENNLERVHELTQRTNQMNFSGNRYDRDVLKKILYESFYDTYVLDCVDRFGSYGVIGFSVVDRREPRMIDLMFSCRIQSKRIEHAFLSYIIRKYTSESGKNFHANYRKTPRNAPSGRVFEDMKLSEERIDDGVSSLVFDKSQSIPDDGIVQIITESQEVFVG